MIQAVAERKVSTETSAATERPEIELLLCCARTQIDQVLRERIKILVRQEFDWKYLIQIASKHGMMSLLYQSLSATFPEAVPQVILHQLRQEFRRNALRNLSLSQELLKILDLFAAADIPVLGFKGPVLTAMAYGDVSLRQFSDLDILVSESDVVRARDLLLSQDAKIRFHVIELTEVEESAFLQSQTVHKFVRESAYEFDCNQGKFILELHWDVIPKYFCFPLEVEYLRENLEPVSILGRTVSNLSPENTLLLLCAHGTKDCWDKLLRVCDIAQIVNSTQVDWGRVIEQAKKRGGLRLLLHGLLLAHNLIGVSLPESAWKRIHKDPKVSAIATQAQKWLFCVPEERPGQVEQFFFHLQTKERLRDQIRYVLNLALTPTCSDWALHPKSAFPLAYYYLLRPLRMLVKHGLKPVPKD
ncbi:MAG TPA: hypothetical protein DDZ80_09165 [Cyanobacteria bacterium UBA8803]|nr:hypothetical protein [Cyanobacteria bacterium UBA9273]HBL58667.1 hypothetical protein [Cyanobacteria bacterium UBA8803]